MSLPNPNTGEYAFLTDGIFIQIDAKSTVNSKEGTIAELNNGIFLGYQPISVIPSERISVIIICS